MTSWLDPLRRTLDDTREPATCFFRDDDVGWHDARMFRLLEVFEKASVPLDLAVIPAEVTDTLARRLRDRLRSAAGRMRVHQHGYRHANHEGVGRKCEFGPCRPAADQAADLQAGQRRMIELFPEFCDPIFTPPWNRCTQTTADLLAAQGYRALSRMDGAAALRLGGLTEISVCVDWCRSTAGSEGRGRLAYHVADLVMRAAPVGIMLHHAVMISADRADLAAFLTLLGSHPNARCVSMRSQIAMSDDAHGAATL